MKLRPLHAIIVLLVALVAGGGDCGHNSASDGSDESEETKKESSTSSEAEEGGTMRADVERVENPGIDRDTLKRLVGDNTAFGMDLYAELGSSDGADNLVFAPYNLSQVLAMVFAGAEGETEKAMRKALRFQLKGETLHGAFNTVDQAVQTESADESEGDETSESGDEESDGPKQVLRTATGVWAQAGFPLRGAYLETLGRHYGAGIRQVDFKNARDEARNEINAWAARETEDKIQDLLSQGSLDKMTRLVLTTAIYFKGQWAEQFDEKNTEEGTFQNAGGDTSKVSMMHQSNKEAFQYADGENYQAVEMPYASGAYSMVLIVPDEGQFSAVRSGIDGKRLESIFGALEGKAVKLTMPKFEFRTGFSAKSALSNLGMGGAFKEDANFDGMSAERELQISDVVHKAFISVDENGTEAAAASAATMKATSVVTDPNWVTVEVDRPFMFAIRHTGTDSVLFFGQVASL